MFHNSFLVIAALASSVDPIAQIATTKIPTVLPSAQIAKPAAKPFPKTIAHEPSMPMQRPARSSAVARSSAAPRSSAIGQTSSAMIGVRPAAVAPQVHFDTTADGVVWARGERWKASFAPQATTFVPFFGSRAPKDYPVDLRVAKVVAGGRAIAFDADVQPVRDGARIRFERDAFTEIYDLGLDSVEQSFVFASAPRDGDLEVRVHVDSELARVPSDEGFALANEHGRIVLGRATVRDAAGRAQEIESELATGDMRLIVPASFLATAVFPVTIDPLISVFAIDTSPANDILPDVAYDATTGNYLTVEQRVFSSSDNDVFTVLTDASGNVISSGYVDVTTNDWEHPHVADNAYASQFMVVAEVRTTTTSSIQGRQSAASAVNFGAVLTISGSEPGDKVLPDIGGDPTFLPPTYYLVTWQRNYASNDTDIHAALFSTSGNNVLFNTIFVDDSASTLDGAPRISKSDGAAPYTSQVWTIVWSHTFSGTDHDVFASQLAWNGAITQPTFVIDSTGNNDEFPVVSSIQDDIGGSRRFMVAAERHSPSSIDIFGWVLDGTSFLAEADLSSMESNGALESLHLGPTIDCDGQRFAVVDSEPSSPGGDFDVWLSTFDCVTTYILPVESQQVLQNTSNFELRPAITSAHSGGGPAVRFMAVWEQSVGAQTDTWGGLYDMPSFTYFCAPNVNTQPCPCGNDATLSGAGCNNSANTGGALLSAAGSPVGDTVVLSTSQTLPHANVVYLQGDANIDGGLPFGDGVRCAGGHLLRLALKTSSGGASSYPEAGDFSITARAAELGMPIAPGSQRYYQAYYRDPANFACSATFNATNGVIIDW